MCLYPRRIKNPKYLPNEKNGGKPPKLKNKLYEFIETKCGWCEECRKEIANNWRQRLLEELKDDPNADMVTLTFSPAAITQLKNEIIKKQWQGLQGTEIEANILAAYAIRMFTERYRKKYKKAPKHWLITELGHESSERIHIHGILWGVKDRNIINKLWGYGNIHWGNYCNIWTINYIIKYVTKVDKVNEGYKQKIMCSKGIGKGYLTRAYRNTYKDDKTNITYCDNKGYTYKLARYYKNKIYTEEQREKLWAYFDDKKIISINGIKFDKNLQDDMDYRNKFYNCLKTARKDNDNIGYGNNLTQTKRYIITKKMEMTKKELAENKQLKEVKAVERRKYTIHEDKKNQDTQELNKTILKDDIQPYIYVGNTTDAQRKRNAEILEAEALNISVRNLRLYKKGIIKLR